MDAAHEDHLKRILENRKAGGRLFPGADLATSSSSGSIAPVPTKQPLQAPGQQSPKKATSTAAAGSGAITIEDGGVRQPAAQAPSPTAYKKLGQQQQLPASSSSSAFRPGAAAAAASSNDSELASVLHEIQHQNQLQAQQLRSLQNSVEQLVANSPPRGGGGGGGVGSVGPTSPRKGAVKTTTHITSAEVPVPVAAKQRVYDQQQQQQPEPYVNRSNDSEGAAEAAGASSPDEIARNMVFADAAALGLVVKPHSIVSRTGTRMISFRSPSRNQRGMSPRGRHGHGHGATSPGGGGGGYGSSTAGGRSMSGDRRRGGATTSTPHRQGGGGGGGALVPYATSPRDAAMTTTMMSSNNNNSSPFVMPRTTRREAIAKPYSTSTLDVDSAIVLLTTGDWFYKLRVDVKAGSLLGPGGWDIMTTSLRYVYLDTTTYILRWGDKPGGSATLWSHFVPIDHIVDIQMNAKNESLRGPEAKVVYYLVLNLVEGGFRARGRIAQRRVCVFGTDMRDQADMWYDALKCISKFYKTRGAASSLAQRTFSSD